MRSFVHVPHMSPTMYWSAARVTFSENVVVPFPVPLR